MHSSRPFNLFSHGTLSKFSIYFLMYTCKLSILVLVINFQIHMQANRDVTRMEIFISLVHLLEQTVKGSTLSAHGIDNDNMMVHHSFHQAASIPATGRASSFQWTICCIDSWSGCVASEPCFCLPWLTWIPVWPLGWF